MRGIPIELSANATLTGAVGSMAVADLGQMQMNHRAPIEVTEIRFTLNSPDVGIVIDPRGIVGVQMDMGPYRMTAGFVPTWMLAPQYNYANQLMLNNPNNTGFVRWILPQPMVLPVGYILRPQFVKLPEWANVPTPTGTVNITTSLVGRALINGKYPRKTRVPYVSAWVAPDNALSNSEIDLRNDLDTTIRVHRMIGRMSDTTQDQNKGGTIANGHTASAIQRVLIKTSYGYNITPSPTLFKLLFPSQNEILPLEMDLGPGEGFAVKLDTAPAYAARPHISFIASREESI